MSLTVLIWLYIASSIAISALLAFSPQLNATRLALLSSLRPSSWRFGRNRRGISGKLLVPGGIFLIVAGIVAATSYNVSDTPTAIGSRSHSGPNDEALARLKDYTRSIASKEPASTPAPGKVLPDVNTMIERLAARLEATPEDIKGWRMLGWSYFHTGRYKQAAAAYGRAVELDPNSAELRISYEEAKAKASSQAQVGDKGGNGLRVEKMAKSETMPPHEHDAKVRSMVDGLAKRLESSPRDVEGWTRLMRSRVVLGEREAAATAFRKALEVFSDDSAASGRITAAAIGLGLNAE
jgi:cytochrome c-type biogenesis protein CcmH